MAATIQMAIRAAPSRAVLGIRNNSTNTVSIAPEPSRNTGCETGPCTAFDMVVKSATESGAAANLKKMAGRKFRATRSWIASNSIFFRIGGSSLELSAGVGCFANQDGYKKTIRGLDGLTHTLILVQTHMSG
jgi:hypothetical protein